MARMGEDELTRDIGSGRNPDNNLWHSSTLRKGNWAKTGVRVGPRFGIVIHMQKQELQEIACHYLGIWCGIERVSGQLKDYANNEVPFLFDVPGPELHLYVTPREYGTPIIDTLEWISIQHGGMKTFGDFEFEYVTPHNVIYSSVCSAKPVIDGVRRRLARSKVTPYARKSARS